MRVKGRPDIELREPRGVAFVFVALWNTALASSATLQAVMASPSSLARHSLGILPALCWVQEKRRSSKSAPS